MRNARQVRRSTLLLCYGDTIAGGFGVGFEFGFRASEYPRNLEDAS